MKRWSVSTRVHGGTSKETAILKLKNHCCQKRQVKYAEIRIPSFWLRTLRLVLREMGWTVIQPRTSANVQVIHKSYMCEDIFICGCKWKGSVSRLHWYMQFCHAVFSPSNRKLGNEAGTAARQIRHVSVPSRRCNIFLICVHICQLMFIFNNQLLLIKHSRPTGTSFVIPFWVVTHRWRTIHLNKSKIRMFWF
jgi:hypothetical protein